jgi:molecular chaperone DnaJ
VPRDFYEVLSVSRDAHEDEIKKAYRKIAFQNHPDRNPGDEQAEQRFKEATEAYEVLRDADKRAKYDQFGHAAVGGAAGAPGARDFSGFDLADALRAFMRDFGGDMGGFEDLFGRAGRRGPQRGDDLRVRLKLTLEEVATGVEKKIRVRHLKTCTTCAGKGGKGEETCTRCKGSGQLRSVQHSIFGQFVNVTTCPTCEGDGQTIRERCGTCKGEGRVSQTETIAVKVPAGVATGNFIPLRGMGDAGPRGGPSGDLVVFIEEKPHDLFERDGLDLHVEVPVSFPVAALGGTVEIPTLDGSTKSVKIPAGTQTGRVVKARDKGLPGVRGGQGDLLARLTVWVPTKLSGDEKKLLEKLRGSHGFDPPAPGRSFYERMKNTFAR